MSRRFSPRRISLLLVLLTLATFGAGASAGDWYASPSGSSLGDGSQANPWDLQTAFTWGNVMPGDTLWLQGGTYSGRFTCTLEGMDGMPITVRPMPDEHVVISGPSVVWAPPTLSIQAQYVTFQDLEITTAGQLRVGVTNTMWPPITEVDVAGGVQTGSAINQGVGCKLINSVVHDAGFGLNAGQFAEGFESTGCLYYFNGFQISTDANGIGRGVGIGISALNSAGAKLFQDNVIFGAFEFSLQVWGDPGPANGITFNGNTYFDAGRMSTRTGGTEAYLGGWSPISGFVFNNNNVYRRSLSGLGLYLGDWWVNFAYIDATVQNNYIAARAQVDYWQSLNFQNNTLVTTENLLYLNTSMVGAQPAYTFDYNTYYGAGETPFHHVCVESSIDMTGNFDAWKTSTGVDAHSTYTAGLPTASAAYVRPNAYDPNRATITIFNWPQSDNVSVDISAVLSDGEAYEVRDVQNYYGAPVLSGTYTAGTPISIPMNLTACAQPAGNAPVPWTHTSAQFGVFILQPPGPQVNQAPTAEAGAELLVMLPNALMLAGSVSDDGLPAACTPTWSMVSGPGTVTFANANAADSKATFSAAGTYVLRLTASDTVLSASDDMTVVARRAGDFTNDGRVDGLDFLNWQSAYPNFVGGATCDHGDGNGDGKVDGLDFLVWQSNYGS